MNSNRISLNVPSRAWIVVSVIVVVQPRLREINLPRHSQVVDETSKRLRILVRCSIPKCIWVPTPAEFVVAGSRDFSRGIQVIGVHIEDRRRQSLDGSKLPECR